MPTRLPAATLRRPLQASAPPPQRLRLEFRCTGVARSGTFRGRMRLLIADKLDVQWLEELRMLGVDLHSRPDLTKDQLAASLDGVGILVVRSTEVTREALAAAPHLNLIVRAGHSVGNIDVEAASERGVYVANCPGRNAAAVAELTMALMLALDRRLLEATSALRKGRWEKGEFSNSQGIMGRQIGIVGLGSVGTEVLKRARAFGLVPHAYSRTLTAAKAARLNIGYASSLEQLAARSDILTIHTTLTSKTRGMVNGDVLRALPDGATVLNTARADVLDYEALAELVPRKHLRVGLDVFPGQPSTLSGEFRSALLSDAEASGAVVYGTPHVGSTTSQSLRAIAQETCRIIRSFLTEEDVPNVVNICATSPARFVLVLRMVDKVGALANTLAVIKRHGINIEEINNTVFDGAQATCTKLRVTGRPSEGCMEEIRAFQEVLHVDVITMPNMA